MNRRYEIDIIKIVAAFLVILLHVVSLGWFGDEDLSRLPVYITLMEAGSLGVPLFFVSTGAIMLQKDRIYDYKKIIRRYIPRFVAALVFFSLCFGLVDYIFMDRYNTINELIWDVLTVKVEQGLWFMNAIICIYLMLPIIKKFVDNASQKEKEYYLIIWFACSMLEFLGSTERFSFVTVYTHDLEYVSLFLHYTGYLILGNYLICSEFSNRRVLFWTVISCLSGMYIIYDFHQDCINGTLAVLGYTVMNYCSPFNIIIVATCIMLAQKAQLLLNDTMKRFLTKLSGLTLGIYLVHLGIIRLMERYMSLSFAGAYILKMLVVAALLYIISAVVAALIKKVPVLGKYII